MNNFEQVSSSEFKKPQEASLEEAQRVLLAKQKEVESHQRTYDDWKDDEDRDFVEDLGEKLRIAKTELESAQKKVQDLSFEEVAEDGAVIAVEKAKAELQQFESENNEFMDGSGDFIDERLKEEKERLEKLVEDAVAKQNNEESRSIEKQVEKIEKQIADLTSMLELVGYADPEGTPQILRDAIRELHDKKAILLSPTEIIEKTKVAASEKERSGLQLATEYLNLKWFEEASSSDKNYEDLTPEQQSAFDVLIGNNSPIFDTEVGKQIKDKYLEQKAAGLEKKTIKYYISLLAEPDQKTEVFKRELRAEIHKVEEYLSAKGIKVDDEEKLREIAGLSNKKTTVNTAGAGTEDAKKNNGKTSPAEPEVDKKKLFSDLMDKFTTWALKSAGELEKIMDAENLVKIEEEKNKLRKELGDIQTEAEKLDKEDHYDLLEFMNGTDIIELLKPDVQAKAQVTEDKNPASEQPVAGSGTTTSSTEPAPVGDGGTEPPASDEALRKRLEDDVRGNSGENWFSRGIGSVRKLLRGEWLSTVIRYAELQRDSDGKWPDENTRSNEKKSTIEKIMNARDARNFLDSAKKIIRNAEIKVNGRITERDNLSKFFELGQQLGAFKSRTEALVQEKNISNFEKNDLGADADVLIEQWTNLNNEIKK